jgi:large subunit ribosomal protein L13
VLERYTGRRQPKFKGNPEKSPYWPKVPDRFVKRLIRGMLPRKKPSGRAAYKKLKVYMGKPVEIKGDPIRVEGADAGRLNRYIKISELCRKLGYESR